MLLETTMMMFGWCCIGTVFLFLSFLISKMLNKVLKVQTYCAVFNVCLLNYVGKQ